MRANALPALFSKLLGTSSVAALRLARGVPMITTLAIAIAGCDRQRSQIPDAAPPAVALADAEPAVAAFIEQQHTALQNTPGNADAWTDYAMALHAHGFLNEAIAAYDEAAKRGKADFRGVYLAALAAESLGAADAATRLQQARELRSDYLPLQLREAEKLLAVDPAAAGELLAKIDAPAQDQPMVDQMLGEAALAEGKAREAIAFLERARNAGLRDRRLWSALARAYRLTNRENEAATAAAHARTGPPETSIADPLLAEVQSQNKSVTAMIERSEQFRVAGRLQEALTLMNEATRFSPENAALHAARARLLATMGVFDEALTAIDRALQLSALLPDGQLLRAQILISLDRLDDAAEAAAVALPHSPQDSQWRALREEIALRRADHRLQNRDLPSAALVLEDLLRAEADSPQAAIRLAQIRNAQEDAAAAIETLDNAWQANPENVLLRTALAWQLATNPVDGIRDGARAVALVEPMVGPAKQVGADTLEALAAAYAESGSFAEALEVIATLERAFAAEPPTSAIAARLRLFRKTYESGRPFRDTPATAPNP
ncbi:MAG: tetratricopeptide repeat protein [Phycisphaerae bacterium]